MNGAAATALTTPAPNGVNMDAQNLTIPAEAGIVGELRLLMGDRGASAIQATAGAAPAP